MNLIGPPANDLNGVEHTFVIVLERWVTAFTLRKNESGTMQFVRFV